MGRGAELLARLYTRLDGLEWLARLVIRLSVGLEFFGSGLGKLGNLPGFVAYFRSLGIPAPELQAPFVAGVECLCGALLVVGLATRPAALMLCGVMAVAIVTAAAPEHHIQASWRGLLELLYLSEWCLLLLLGWLVLAGPGPASLDARVGRRSRRRRQDRAG
jgi:putative oxidoreductase